MKRIQILLFAILIVSVLQAKEKKFSKTFDAKGITTVKLENKYGDIKIENWEKQEISVNVRIKAEGSRKKKIERIFKNTNIDFKNSNETLSVSTEFGSFFSFMKFTNRLFQSGNLSINYEIKLPKDINLDIELSNGNIILFERDGNVKIKHKEGNIAIENVKGQGFFDLKDSSLQLDNSNELTINSRNSNVIIKNGNSLKINSYNSEIEITELKNLEGETEQDNLKIGDLEQALLTSASSNITFGKLQNSGIFNLSKGSFTLEQIDEKFEEVKITSKNTNLAILLTPTAANLVISHHLSTKMDLAETMDFCMKFGETQKDFITTGVVGNPLGVNKLFIDAKGGELHLK